MSDAEYATDSNNIWTSSLGRIRFGLMGDWSERCSRPYQEDTGTCGWLSQNLNHQSNETENDDFLSSAKPQRPSFPNGVDYYRDKPNVHSIGIAAVFDGHGVGGREAALTAKRRFLESFASHYFNASNSKSNTDISTIHSKTVTNDDDPLIKFEGTLQKVNNECEQDVIRAAEAGVAALRDSDEAVTQLCRDRKRDFGTTAVIAMELQGSIVMLWTGDSACLFIPAASSATPLQLTDAHVMSRATEERRVLAEGGGRGRRVGFETRLTAFIQDLNVAQKFGLMFAMTRALGHPLFKFFGVRSSPEVKILSVVEKDKKDKEKSKRLISDPLPQSHHNTLNSSLTDVNDNSISCKDGMFCIESGVGLGWVARSSSLAMIQRPCVPKTLKQWTEHEDIERKATDFTEKSIDELISNGSALRKHFLTSLNEMQLRKQDLMQRIERERMLSSAASQQLDETQVIGAPLPLTVGRPSPVSQASTQSQSAPMSAASGALIKEFEDLERAMRLAQNETVAFARVVEDIQNKKQKWITDQQQNLKSMSKSSTMQLSQSLQRSHSRFQGSTFNQSRHDLSILSLSDSKDLPMTSTSPSGPNAKPINNNNNNKHSPSTILDAHHQSPNDTLKKDFANYRSLSTMSFGSLSSSKNQNSNNNSSSLVHNEASPTPTCRFKKGDANSVSKPNSRFCLELNVSSEHCTPQKRTLDDHCQNDILDSSHLKKNNIPTPQSQNHIPGDHDLHSTSFSSLPWRSPDRKQSSSDDLLMPPCSQAVLSSQLSNFGTFDQSKTDPHNANSSQPSANCPHDTKEASASTHAKLKTTQHKVGYLVVCSDGLTDALQASNIQTIIKGCYASDGPHYAGNSSLVDIAQKKLLEAIKSGDPLSQSGYLTDAKSIKANVKTDDNILESEKQSLHRLSENVWVPKALLAATMLCCESMLRNDLRGDNTTATVIECYVDEEVTH